MKLLLACVLAVSLSAHARADKVCGVVCDQGCPENKLCVDLPPLISCKALQGACKASCAVTCQCFQGCINDCRDDSAVCKNLDFPPNFKQLGLAVPKSVKNVLCSYVESACNGLCYANCPGQTFFSLIRNMLSPPSAVGAPIVGQKKA